MAEAPIGGSNLDSGGGAQVGNLSGTTGASARNKSAVDAAQFKVLNQEFDKLNKHLKTYKQELTGVIKQTKEWANALKGVSQGMGSVSGGGGGSSYLPAAGSGTTVASGNQNTVTQIVNVPGPGGGGGGGGGGGMPPVGKGGRALSAFDQIASMVGAGIQAMDSRAERGASYALSADRMNMLYQQMSGLSRNQVYHQYREPLGAYKLGFGGQNELLGFQARTGISAQMMAPSVESLRIASGFGYSTSDILGMTQSLASAQSNNRLFMMLGTGMYGIGGKQKSPTEVYKDIITRTGLTDKSVIQGAMQQGSMQRYKLMASGVPEDQIDFILQMAQQNATFQEKTGGRMGFYDPSKKEHAKVMGINDNYAMQFEETQRRQGVREEKFANRQTDNFAKMEKNTQQMVGLMEGIDEKLSGIYGALIETGPYRKSGPAKILGRMVSSVPVLGPLVTGLTGIGDPVGDSKDMPKKGGESTAKKEDTPNIKKSAAKLATLNPKLAARVKDMMRDNPRLSVSSAGRSSATQKNIFLDRYRPTDEVTNVYYAGSYWKHVKGAAAAPPGLSMHEIGLAADMYGDEDWVAKNAHKYGLKSFYDVNNEPWHVQPVEFPYGRAKYEKEGAKWGTRGEKFDPSTIWNSVSADKISESQLGSEGSSSSGGGSVGADFAWANMSMGEIIASGGVGVAGGSGGGGGSAETGSYSGTPVASAGSTSTSSGGALSGPEIAKLMYNAGFRGTALKRAIAIAWRESRFKPNTIYKTSNEESYGLMQINMINKAVPGLSGAGMGTQRLKRFKLNSANDLLNPETNARVAYELWSGKTSGQGDMPGAHWTPWGGPDKIDPKQVKKAETYIREAKLPEGDPVISQSASKNYATNASSALYNITVSPVITINSSSGASTDSQKVARDVASMMEREIRLTMMRTS